VPALTEMLKGKDVEQVMQALDAEVKRLTTACEGLRGVGQERLEGIRVLDADDEFQRESTVARRQWLGRVPEVNVLGLYRRYPYPGLGRDSVSVGPRLWRNGRGLCYESPIHEKLVTADGQKIQRLDIGSNAEAEAFKQALETASFSVGAVEAKPAKRHPYPPFTTSTLQQAAGTLPGLPDEEVRRWGMAGIAATAAIWDLDGQLALAYRLLRPVRVSPGTFAPATYKITAKTENASTCVWDLGDEPLMEVVNDAPASQERLVYFQKPGDYVIKLAAVNGARQDQKALVVTVRQPPEGSVGVVLTATDTGTHVKTNTFGRMPPSKAWRSSVPLFVTAAP